MLLSRDGTTWSDEDVDELAGQPVSNVARVVVTDRQVLVAAHLSGPERVAPGPSAQVLLVGTPR